MPKANIGDICQATGQKRHRDVNPRAWPGVRVEWPLAPPTERNPWGHLVPNGERQQAKGARATGTAELLKPPTLQGSPILGRDKGQLKRVNKRRRIERQLEQPGTVDYWSTHKEKSQK
ncbi:hypothetical protein THAOC_20720, partial [Thalassiosira oceanica]